MEEEAPVEPEPVVEEEKPKEKSPEKKEPEVTGSLEFVEVFEETVSLYLLLGISSVELNKIQMYLLSATYHWDCPVPFKGNQHAAYWSYGSKNFKLNLWLKYIPRV